MGKRIRGKRRIGKARKITSATVCKVAGGTVKIGTLASRMI
jgi:hypothetical protein